MPRCQGEIEAFENFHFFYGTKPDLARYYAVSMILPGPTEQKQGPVRFIYMDVKAAMSFLKRFREGDAGAFEEIVRAHQDRVYNLCRYMLGNARDAEDAAQDVFIKAYRNLNAFEPAPSFSAWLYRIAVNTCIDYRRKAPLLSFFRTSAEGRELTMEPRSALPSPEKSYESKVMGTAIEKSLSRISGKLRTVIVLKEIEGLSYEEISSVLGISIGTVKSRISRARDELKKLLRDFTNER